MFRIIKAIKQPKVRLICFGYAGGSTQTFFNWPEFLPDHVEFWLVQLPGHGSELLKPPLTNMGDIVKLLMQSPPDDQIPYVILGHSLGAKIAWEYMKALLNSGARAPYYFIASGSGSPTVKSHMYDKFPLNQQQVVEELLFLKGTPKEVLNNKELMNMFMPTLMADFNLVAGYCETSGFTTDIPLCLMAGQHDERVDISRLDEWKEVFTGKYTLHIVDDEHFFIETSRDWYIDVVEEVLNELLC